MEEFLDNLWFKIINFFYYIASLLDTVFAPLNLLGPAFAISTIALLTVIITKILIRTFKTKRYQELKKEFEHWYNIRQEALKCEDPEKARLLAKNIDQAELNKVYWDYFLEGFLISLMTKLLPVFSFLVYVNEAYNLENLLKLFGREYVFKISKFNGEAFYVGSAFWFIVSILLIYLAWFIIGKLYSKHLKIKKQPI